LTRELETRAQMADSNKLASWRDAPRWMKLVLVLSLLANALVVGLVAGSMLSFEERFENEPGLDRQQTRIFQMVPEDRREEARGILMSRQAERDAARDAMRAAQQQVFDAIRRDPFDAVALSAALAQRREASGQLWSLGYDQIADIAKTLTPEERANLAEAMEERSRRWLERQQASKP